ncbi:MAG TPA: ferredoxin family protein [Gemmataceae bacterium]|nr:ferredoxin family protein [Gemmataceae bacterium]
MHVVLSQAQGKHPVRRALEESLVAALLVEPGIELAILPHLYDLDAEHPGRLHLGAVRTDMVILSWLYPRAAYWCLDRAGIKGQEGATLLVPAAEEDESDDGEKTEGPQGIGALDVPSDRYLYCIDLRNETKVDAFVEEIRRIAAESASRAESKIAPVMVELNLAPLKAAAAGEVELKTAPRFTPDQLLTQPGRRWYPVIDYSRCTNCMECIDFCLFGVYGLDDQERILVESQDACKKGCPACSRVCPEHAIIFPEYKTPAIAGAPVGGIESLKIDLTRLFGGGDAMKIAAQERDRELVADGRDAVGMTIGIPKRQADKPAEPKDDLDKLMDSLDALDL